jgi:hypothetical protein
MERSNGELRRPQERRFGTEIADNHLPDIFEAFLCFAQQYDLFTSGRRERAP